MQWIRLGILNTNEPSPIYTVIDSLPLPLCLPIRNLRAKTLKEYANIGYNATKKMYYYGLKGNFEVDNEGNIRAYVLSKASVHDVKMVKTLLNEFSSSYVLADQGYIDKKLKEELKQKGITFWTPVRKNMKQDKENTKYLNKKRRYIETVFSKLVSLFDIERIRVKSISGFISRLEQCLLVYTLENIN